MKKGIMKLLTATLLFLCASATAYAQQQYEYHPYVKEGKVWNYEVTETYIDEMAALASKKYDRTCRIEGDTIVGGRPCKKFITTQQDTTWQTYIYEENQCVYEYLPIYINNVAQPSRWMKSYDFSMREGDELIWYDEEGGYRHSTYQVVSADTIFVKNRFYRRIYIGLMYDEEAKGHPWTEGIGTHNGSLEFVVAIDGRFPRYSLRLKSVVEDGEVIFEYEDFGAKPVTSGIHESVLATDEGNLDKTFDLQGRRVANPQKGIYVRNGKKVVVK